MVRVFKNSKGQTRFDISKEAKETLKFIKELEKEINLK